MENIFQLFAQCPLPNIGHHHVLYATIKICIINAIKECNPGIITIMKFWDFQYW